MNDLESLLKSSVDAAFEKQRDGSTTASPDVKANLIRRGRRRFAGRVTAALAMSVVLFAGAASATSALLRRDTEVAGPEAPDMGAARVLDLGGAIASDDRSLWIGSDATSNTAGNLNGISRVDLATEESVDGPPAVGSPLAMAAGRTGIWTVGFEGDMPVGGEGHPVRGAIERVDPVTLERTGHIPREDSAPYDVAIGTVGGEEVAWVVDAGRHELLRVDAESMEIDSVYEMPRSPVSVVANGRFVYVTSSDAHVVVRMDVQTEEVTTFDVPRCAKEAVLGGGSLWVVDYCGDALQRIDEDGSDETVSIAVGEAPNSIEYAEGLVWVSTLDGVVRVDPATNEIVGNRIFVSEMTDALLYAGGSMWASSWDGTFRLSEDIPPSTPTPPPPPTPDPRDEALPPGVERVEVPRDPQALATGDGSLWAGLFEIARVDAVTGEVQAEIDPGGIVESMVFDDAAGVLWVLVEVAEKETNGVVAIDADTNEVVLGPVLLDKPGVYGQAMTARDGVAWVAGDPMLFRIELAGDVERIDIGEHFGGPDETSGFNVVATDAAVFVVPVNGAVVRVDLETFDTEQVADLGWNVSGLVTDGTTVWLLQMSGETSEILLWTLDGTTGEPAGEPVVVAKFGFERIAQHDGLVWVVQGGLRGGAVRVKAYEGGTGEPVRTVDLPASPFMNGVAAGPEGVWVTTGHEFVYRVAPE